MRTEKDTTATTSLPASTAMRRSAPWCRLALLLLATLPALSAVHSQFLWTDGAEIVQGGLIRELGAPLRTAITAGIDGHYYRPTVFLIHSLNAWLFGPNPLAFRLTNYGFHVLNVVLLYALARRLLEDSRLALAAAVLFAVHPIAVTTLAWCSDRTDAVALAASLGVVLGALSFRRRGSAWMLAGVWTVLLLRLGAKETAASSLVVVAAMAFRALGTERRRLVVLVVGGAALCGAWIYPADDSTSTRSKALAMLRSKSTVQLRYLLQDLSISMEALQVQLSPGAEIDVFVGQDFTLPVRQLWAARSAQRRVVFMLVEAATSRSTARLSELFTHLTPASTRRPPWRFGVRFSAERSRVHQMRPSCMTVPCSALEAVAKCPNLRQEPVANAGGALAALRASTGRVDRAERTRTAAAKLSVQTGLSKR